MRHFRTIVFLAVALTAASASAEGLKLGFVNMEQVFQKYWKTIRADAALKKQTQVWRTYIDELREECEGLREECKTLRDEAQDIIYTAEVREKKKEAAQAKLVEYQEKAKHLDEYRNEKKAEGQRTYLKQRAELVAEIAQHVQRFAKEKNLDVVLDSSGKTLNEIPAFIYYREDLDFTPSLLADLNKGHEDEVAAAEEKQSEDQADSGQ
jgi:Skp family chaperone for outer membrane proteins